MLDALLGESEATEFIAKNYRRLPFSVPNGAIAIRASVTWEKLFKLAARVPAHDVLVVRNGELFPKLLPRKAEEVDAHLRQGFSLVFRNTDRLDSALGKLARDLEARLSGRAALQLYVTPAKFHSFGWHYDAEEVFIVQAEGTKEYFLRENTVNPKPRLAEMPRDMQYEKEITPMLGCVLAPGDWLYIPGGWWHYAEARSDSLSISLGLLAPGME